MVTTPSAPKFQGIGFLIIVIGDHPPWVPTWELALFTVGPLRVTRTLDVAFRF